MTGKQLRDELLTAARFGLVGLGATATHILIVWLLLARTSLPPVAANTLAFLSAFGISFVGNYLWTFHAPGNPGRAIRRFFLIALGAFMINTLLLVFLVRGGWFTPAMSAVISAAFVPLISFMLSRFWGFQSSKENSR